MKNYWKIQTEEDNLKLLEDRNYLNGKITLNEKNYIKIKLSLMQETQEFVKQETLYILDKFFRDNSQIDNKKVCKTLNNERCMILNETKLKKLKELLKCKTIKL